MTTYYRPKINGKFASTVWFKSEQDARKFVNMTRGLKIMDDLKIIKSTSPKTRKQISSMF